MVMDLFAEVAKGLFLDLEAGLHELLIKLVLHRLFLPGRKPAAIVDIGQHHDKEDAKEQQYDDNCKDGCGYHRTAVLWRPLYHDVVLYQLSPPADGPGEK